MKCFHFSDGHARDDGAAPSSMVSWARSFSVASSTATADSHSRDFSDSFALYDLLSHNRSNHLRVFSFTELKSATRGFSRALMIGEGGFGSVFRGVVSVPGADADSRLHVAVKQLNRNGFQGHKEWINEVHFLGVVKHPNLVKLIGYCAEDDERGIQRLLVYELMRNKSLEDHLLSRLSSPLPWKLRLKIARDSARGLAYLHEEMDFQLIFRDFKTSNILLDEDFNAKLSDFGLARQGPSEGLSHVSTIVVGTVGYAAPEYVNSGRLTAKSDVWSFGVVLYELITGRRAIERNLPRGEQKLLEWIKPYISDWKKFYLILDPRLDGDNCINSARKLACLANKCLSKHPKSRPKMSEVVEMLGNIISKVSEEEEETPCEKATADVELIQTEDTKIETTTLSDSMRRSNHSWRKFDIREIVNLRNRSVRKLDWRNWTPGLVRTW